VGAEKRGKDQNSSLELRTKGSRPLESASNKKSFMGQKPREEKSGRGRGGGIKAWGQGCKASREKNGRKAGLVAERGKLPGVGKKGRGHS